MDLINKIQIYRDKRHFKSTSYNILDAKYYRDLCPVMSRHMNIRVTSRVTRSLARGQTRTHYKHALRLVFQTGGYLIQGDEITHIQSKKIINISEYKYRSIIHSAYAKKDAVLKTHLRNLIIPAKLETFAEVYNGQFFKKIRLRNIHAGFRLGALVMTRKILKHGKAGKGATQGSKHVELK